MVTTQDYYSLLNEIKIEDVFEDFSKDKEVFDVSNCLAKSKCYYHTKNSSW